VDSGFWVLRFRVWDLEVKVWDVGHSIEDVELKGLGCRVQDLGFKGLRVWDVEFWV
jgi:hypothetical protein